ncbi:transposable element Tc3 transposase [Trichonephila clavipes]|nr:transposable element Tc3 transposase [Trichonephila clavipes]
MEMVGPKHQTEIGIVIQLGWSVGFVTLVGVVWFFRSWFWLQLVISLTLLPFAFSLGILPESPRWLLTRGKIGKYKKLLTKAAAVNGRDVQEDIENLDLQKEELWFQQDGATCHTARATIDLLKDTFGDRLISRFGSVNWPPRSCDLTPLDYFLWGYVKSLVYADKPQTLDHLEDSIRRVIADIRPQICQVIYSQFGLAIHPNDHQARRRFVEWAQNEIAVVPDFHKRILFSDEAHFWWNGYVNKQNCRIWSEANPQVYVETPLHPEKLTVWCALWAGGIIGPYFFKNDEGHNVTVNGDRYRAMITNFLIPELNNHDVQELWFQQDGATCHTARATIDLLKDTFGDRLISRFGPVNWPPRSCDLTPLNYFLWGYVKSLVYVNKPQTLDHLEDNIRRVIADIRPQMLEKVIENWTSRLDYIRASRGSHMPMPQDYLSNKKNPSQSNNTSLFYCNLKFYTSKKTPFIY